MKIKSRIAKICMAVAMITLTLLPGYSAKAVTTENSNVISTAECVKLAEYWLDLYYAPDTYIDDIVPVSNGQSICSYCVSFVSAGSPCGYIVIDSDRNAVNNVTEFCFSGEGIYDILCLNYGIAPKNVANEKILYSTGFFDYAIPVDTEATVFYNSTDELMNKQTLIKQCTKTADAKEAIADSRSLYLQNVESSPIYSVESDKESYYEGFFTSGTLPSSGNYSTKTIIGASTFIPSTMSSLRASGGFSGNCTPTAATNILSFYKEKRGFSSIGSSRKNIYDGIVSNSGWNQFGNVGMTFSQATRGMKSVVNGAGYSFSSDTYWLNLWSDWKRDLGNDFPILTSVYGYKQNAGSWEDVGHAIVAVGYREYESGAKYLRVYDGWNTTNDKYIYFNSNYFTSVNGVCIKVSN